MTFLNRIFHKTYLWIILCLSFIIFGLYSGSYRKGNGLTPHFFYPHASTLHFPLSPSLKMLLFCSHLKSVLFVSFHAYFILKVIISITYLAFHTRYSIIRYANGFSDNCNYCDVAEEKLNFNKTETLVDLH